MPRKTILSRFAACVLLAPAVQAVAADADDFLRSLAESPNGIQQMSEEDAEDFRASVNNGVDPDNFEPPQSPAEEPSPEQAIRTPDEWKELLAKGNQGDAEANYLIGLCGAKGHLVPQDLKKAFSRFFAAARKSHTKAMFFAARCLEQKIGVKTAEDETAAAKIIPQYYMFAATSGDTYASYHLARYLKYKSGATYDREYVARHFRVAAEKGHAAALHELALCYREGEGVPRLRKLSSKFLRDAAERGYGKAQFDLGLCYAAGSNRVAKNLIEAYAWLATAISNGVPDESWALENLKNQMPAQDLETAKSLASEYAAKYKTKPLSSNPLL